LDAKDYLTAGMDRWKDAINLFERERYLGACYVAGYTGECILKYVIMKYKNILDYNSVKSLLSIDKKAFREEINNGRSVRWLDYEFRTIDEFNDTVGKFGALKDHKMERLIDLAIKTTALKRTTMTMFKRSASYCLQWSEEWRYGKPFLLDCAFISQINEEITKEKAQEFLTQIYWLINQIKQDTNDIRIELVEVERGA
jgi:hypothetical protein